MYAHDQMLAILQSLGWPELLVIGLIALIIFGKRLPEVGRSLGQSFVEFKKGLKETGDQLNKIGDKEEPEVHDTHESTHTTEVKSVSRAPRKAKSVKES